MDTRDTRRFPGFFAVAALVAVVLFAPAPALHAQVSNQALQLTFSDPIRIPGRVLPPGTYWFTVMDVGGSANLNEVQIMNADRTKVVAQVNGRVTDKAPFGQETTANGLGLWKRFGPQTCARRYVLRFSADLLPNIRSYR